MAVVLDTCLVDKEEEDEDEETFRERLCNTLQSATATVPRK